jgi:hypothetical protein
MSPWKKQTGKDFSVSFSQSRWVNQEKTGYNPQTIRGVSSKWSDFKNHIMSWKKKENIVELWVVDKNNSTKNKLLMIIIQSRSRRFKKGKKWGKRKERDRKIEIQHLWYWLHRLWWYSGMCMERDFLISFHSSLPNPIRLTTHTNGSICPTS